MTNCIAIDGPFKVIPVSASIMPGLFQVVEGSNQNFFELSFAVLLLMC